MQTLKKKKRAYGKIDEKILIEALGRGMTKTKAGRLAGSLAISDSHVIGSVNEILEKRNKPHIKRTILQLLQDRQRKILESITDEEIEKAPLNQKTVAFGIITDKEQLIRGDVTNRVEVIPRMVITETPKLKAPTN